MAGRDGREPPLSVDSLRRTARRVVRSSTPPTVAIGIRPARDELSQRRARAVLELALTAGEALLSLGLSAADVVATILRITRAYGIRGTHVDVNYTSMQISAHRGADHDPLTMMRVVRVRATDFSRLQEVQSVVRQITEEQIDTDDAMAMLEKALRRPHPYRRWIVTAAQGLLGFSVAWAFGAGWFMMVLAALSTALVDVVLRGLGRTGLPAFFTQAIGAAIPTLVAVGLFAARGAGMEIPGRFSPSLVVVTGIIALLAGLSAVGAAQDALDGYYVTATGRAFEVIMQSLGIVVGISLVLGLAHQLGVQMDIQPLGSNRADPLARVVGPMAATFAFAISGYARTLVAYVATASAGLAGVLALMADELAVGAPVRASMAAIVLGVASQIVIRWRIPALAITTAGIVSFLPGLAIYRGLFFLTDPGDSLNAALLTLLDAAGIGLGLASGLWIGSYVVRRVRGDFDLLLSRVMRRSRAGARQ